jgi:hypothetical protein
MRRCSGAHKNNNNNITTPKFIGLNKTNKKRSLRKRKVAHEGTK